MGFFRPPYGTPCCLPFSRRYHYRRIRKPKIRTAQTQTDDVLVAPQSDVNRLANVKHKGVPSFSPKDAGPSRPASEATRSSSPPFLDARSPISESMLLLTLLPQEWRFENLATRRLYIWKVKQFRSRTIGSPLGTSFDQIRGPLFGLRWPRYGVSLCTSIVSLEDFKQSECYLVLRWCPNQQQQFLHLWFGAQSPWKARTIACTKAVELCKHFSRDIRHVREIPGHESELLRSYFVGWHPESHVVSQTTLGSKSHAYEIGGSWTGWGSVSLSEADSNNCSSKSPRTDTSRRRRKSSDPGPFDCMDSDAFKDLVAKGRRLECSRLWCIGRTATRRKFMDVQLVPCRAQSLAPDCSYILDSIPPGSLRRTYKWSLCLYDGASTCELTRTYARLSFQRLLEEKGRDSVIALNEPVPHRDSIEFRDLPENDLRRWFWDILSEGDEIATEIATEPETEVSSNESGTPVSGTGSLDSVANDSNPTYKVRTRKATKGSNTASWSRCTTSTMASSQQDFPTDVASRWDQLSRRWRT
eukprot:Gregarina_sp_Poly_1__7250@NODE_398_length_8931_cov_68_540952_g326_i0_p2_GENE_NODE_398_length_8931_cov_68_540952_g326_i0NODE_398_length_8931_cov_68_540952_g326_i0_p2_ORF_typecomplete_len528_score30_04Gelsolin/PF00626_22/0_00028Gelsolin/PF00626_22/14_NODE_398_length_8931_cov_68_540952_g326_i0441627